MEEKRDYEWWLSTLSTWKGAAVACVKDYIDISSQNIRQPGGHYICMLSEYMSRALTLQQSVYYHLDLSIQVVYHLHRVVFQETNAQVRNCMCEQSASELFWA
jgi:hypothetical protein